MTPIQALAMAEALVRAARIALEDNTDAIPSDTFAAPAQKALDDLQAEIDKHKAI